jgi:hypothetical protein
MQKNVTRQTSVLIWPDMLIGLLDETGIPKFLLTRKSAKSLSQMCCRCGPD